MIQPLLKYPDPTVRLISANVRFFNDELRNWIADMCDTMRANDLEALSAILIGIQYSIIVIKEGENYIPYINARLIKHAEVRSQTERSIYYEGISVDVDRYNKVTVIYEDENGDPHHRDLRGDEARTFQQHLDYCYGSTFVDRVDREMKQRINDHLEHGLVQGGGACPVVFVRDYFKRAANIGMGLILFSFTAPFFVSPNVQDWVYTIDRYALIGVAVLIVTYFFYAQYEAKIYKQCTSCQTGHTIGTTAILGIKLALTALIVFLWIAP